MFVFRFIVVALCLAGALQDCPLSNYPRRTVIGYIEATLTENTLLHDEVNEYSFPIENDFNQGKIDVAIGLVKLQTTPNLNLNFYIQHVMSSERDQIRFRILTQGSSQWQSIRFSFLASQSHLLQMDSYKPTQFSSGIEEGSYAIYQRLPSIQNHLQEPIVKVFLHGCKLSSQSLNNPQYLALIDKFNSFNRFSANNQLIDYFAQSIQQYQALSVEVEDVRMVGQILSFSLKTKNILESISFSYILFSKKIFTEMHNQVNGDFTLSYGSMHEFTGLSNMEMVFAGVNAIMMPRKDNFNFDLEFQNFLGRSVFSAATSHPFMLLSFSFVAFEIKHKYVCSDCKDSPFIFQNFCVEKCPRSYSQVITGDNSYCQRCSIDEFKVIDPKTFECVCARRFYPSMNRCQPCRYDCFSCQDRNACLTCDNDLRQTKRTLINGNCVCPSIGYYDDRDRQDIVCQKCDDSCRTCNGPYAHDCLSCENDKQLDNFGHCVCRNGLSLVQSGQCLCLPPAVFFNGECVNANVQCNENQTQQIQGLSTKCACKDGFISVLDKCVKCQENQLFNQDTLECDCTNKTIRFENRCVFCGVNQIYNEASKKCVCDGNTFEVEDGRSCVKCPPKMTYQNGKCECIFNYYLSSQNVCKRCERETDGPKCRSIVI